MKKPLIYTAVIGLIISVLVLGCNNGTLDTLGDSYSGGPLVCFGDSLTAGYGAAAPGKDDKTKSYPAYLQDKVNIPVINAGVSGDTTSDALSRIETDVLSHDPGIVIIELGANDLFQRIPPEITKANMQAIIDLLDNGRRKIYMARFYTEAVAQSMAGNLGILGLFIPTLIAQYDEMYNSLAPANNIELIEDIWAGVWGIHMSDAVHPNAEGYEIMADNYFNAMEPYLRGNKLLNQ
jgi:acyl-CoA thioesterase-1